MGHHHSHEQEKGGNIKVAFFLNISFTIIEIIGGILTNSVAILSDALHDLGDSLSLGLAWYFEKKAKKGRSENFSFGYKRFSLLGALINAIVLIIGSIFILREAIPRIINPEPVDTKGMILLAILGIFVNGLAVLRLKKGTSLNEKVISLHLLEDVFGWIAVLIGAIAIYYFNIPIIDPILSFLIAGFILFNVYKNLNKVIKVIMQGTPINTNLEKITSYFNSVNQIHDIHDLHIWSMDGEYNVLTAHIVLKEGLKTNNANTLKTELKENLFDLGINHSTLEFENINDKCIFQEH